MAFKKIALYWCLITIAFAALFYAVAKFIKGHPTWPWAAPVLYIGVLILFSLYVLTAKKKE
jgi:hypothetical protein